MKRDAWLRCCQQLRKRSGADCRGQALLEFALLLPLLALLSFGSITVGMIIDRYMAVRQLVRDAGNMYARNVDFSLVQNKQVLLLAATDMRITTTGGQGVIYLSQVVKAPTGTSNAGKLVIAQRFVIGNSSIAQSAIGTPLSSIWPDRTNPQPNGDVHDYNNQPSAVATLPAVMSTITVNERIFVAEVFHPPTDLVFPGFFQPNLLYARAYF